MSSLVLAWLSMSVGTAGQVSYVEVGLREVVARSQVIVEAMVDEPARGTVMIDVAPDHPGLCEGSPTATYRVLVQDVLKDEVGLKSAQGRLVVHEGNTSARVELQQRSCVDGVRKSPIFVRYGERREVFAGDRLLFFLAYDERLGFELVASWSFAPARLSRRVKKWL